MPALRYSLAGLRTAWHGEAAFRLELILTPPIAAAALCFGSSGLERALLLGSWLLVPLTELINSAIEATIDRIGSESHPLSGQAKDLGSAAVFVALLIAATCWLLILV